MSLLSLPLLLIDDAMTMTADLERDHATLDDAGGKPARDWQPLATVPCLLWFGTGSAATRIGQTRPMPQETADIAIGGIVMPDDTDVTARDRITSVTDADGRQVTGLLQILAVAPFRGLTEISFRQAS